MNTAVFLLEHAYTLDAVYLSGYVTECSLKALILERTPEPERADTLARITKGAQGHNPEVLSGVLRDLGIRIPLGIVSRFRRFQWTTSLRYQAGRKPNNEARGYLRTAELVYNWVNGELL